MTVERLMVLEPLRLQPLVTPVPQAGSPAAAWGQDTLLLSAPPQAVQGTSWSGVLATNHGQEVSVVIPPGFRADKPAELIVFYHGSGGSAADSTQRLQKLIQGLPQKGRNALVVIPSWEAKSRQAGTNLIAFQDEAQAKAEQVLGRKIDVRQYTVQGYSRGGLPIAQAAQAGQLRAGHIVLFDSTYGQWGEAIVQGRQAGSTVSVFYTDHNAKRAARLKNQAGVTVEAAGTSHGGTPLKHFYR